MRKSVTIKTMGESWEQLMRGGEFTWKWWAKWMENWVETVKDW